MSCAPSNGFLAIWSDIAAEEETDYLHWLTREHVQERLSVDGFRSVRVFRLLERDVRRYLINYELETADVLGSQPYLARLNAPSEWSRRIMTRVRRFARGGGRLRARAGCGQAGLLGVARFAESLPADGADLADSAVGLNEIVSARYLETDLGRSAISTNEKTLRGGDEAFAGLLLIEGLTSKAVTAAFVELKLDIHDGVYAEVFELRRDSLQDFP